MPWRNSESLESGLRRHARERVADTLCDFLDAADSIDFVKLLQFGEMRDQRRGLLPIHGQALAYRFGMIVVTAFGIGASRKTLEQEVFADEEIKRGVEWFAETVEQRFERRGLRQIARITVEDE